MTRPTDHLPDAGPPGGPADGDISDLEEEIDQEVDEDVVDAELMGDESDAAGPAGEPGILTDVVALQAERDEYLLALQRVQAEFENYRKRVLRQQEEQAARAALDLVGKLLPVLDTLDLAEAHLESSEAGSGPTPDAKALSQSRAQFIDVLSKEGLERVDEAEVPFDPEIHDAVAHTPAPESANGGEGKDPHGKPVVDEVLRSGYRWRGQVLRPAMVRVRD